MGSERASDPHGLEGVLEGRRLKKIFKNAEVMAALHATLTSRRGGYFRKQLLHRLGEGGSAAMIEQLRQEAGVEESTRHIQKLLQFHLIEAAPKEGAQEFYARTADGEAAVNAIRQLERDITPAAAQRIYEASLGPHSIQLFLMVYSDRRTPDFKTRRLRYSPQEAGQLAYFLPRSVEALAAVDKLNESGLLAYEDDGYVYADPSLLRGFYKYLLALLEIVARQQLIEGA